MPVERFRKLPVTVDTVRWDGTADTMDEVQQWSGHTTDRPLFRWVDSYDPVDVTAEVWSSQEHAWIPCPIGHRVVKGKVGELYPISQSAVDATYMPRPAPITVLCGSTRFYDAFQQANYDLTMAGHIVLSVGFYPHAKAEHGHGEVVGHDSAEKVALDELHLRKIDLADEVLILNVGGYIGDSTRREIRYAEKIGKPISYLEPINQMEGTRHHGS